MSEYVAVAGWNCQCLHGMAEFDISVVPHSLDINIRDYVQRSLHHFDEACLFRSTSNLCLFSAALHDVSQSDFYC